MGQLNAIMMNEPEVRVLFDEAGDNGLALGGKYIPEELLSQILSYGNYKDLCQYQLVCKRWNHLIQSYVWRKKAEMTLGHLLPVNNDIPWTLYYFICTKRAFRRNLIKNHSGEKKFSNWTITANGGNRWKVENPPDNVPKPEDVVFEGKKDCFVTSYDVCAKYQVIDLLKEGFTKHFLDVIQPPIHVSEWYCCRWDCPATYFCKVELLLDKEGSDEDILDHCKFVKKILNEDQDQWFKFEHKFENYGKGLRKIKFLHGGKDEKFWAGHYGSKMAGACVYFDLPNLQEHHYDDEPNSSLVTLDS
ncbi:hypothetical protein QAD02_024157 [Eretmocerus hayati]|uniref:Uncharacterized protein n=1 Tax=Eretmocerus hayati TaxID=131215 RepID=A0ACC2Q1B6_9HYME|nr:hypothetical protein QAD02_024157 [Eretmocerus hayati]